MRELARHILILMALLSPEVSAGEEWEIVCPRLRVSPAGELEISETERLLVCGDPKNVSWSNIPDSQARFHLSTFLQDRGYFFPEFSSSPERLDAKLGEKTKVRIFEIKNAPEDFEPGRLRKIKGEVLTPGLLDAVKVRIRHRLQTLGYACPEVEMKAVASTGTVTAEVRSGKKLNILRADAEPIEGLSDEVPHRYRAFQLEQLYNPDYLAVTVHRILEEGFVQSTHFGTNCREDGVWLSQKFVPGPPRLVRIGFGVDTEQLLIARAGWSHNRLGEMASSLDLTAAASFRVQELGATMKWFFLPYPSRYYLRPSFQVKRNVEQHFESYEGRLQVAPGMTWDGRHLGLSTHFGPVLNFVDTVVGVGPDNSKFLSLGGDLALRTHYFEFYRSSPQDGLEIKLDTNLTFRNALSNVNAQLFRMAFIHNWNVLSLDPAWMVISIRGGMATTRTEEDVRTSSLLPVSFKHFLGGSTNLRGFGRLELPDESGALTSAFGGVEMRFSDLLPFKFQPLVFTDAGIMGTNQFALESPVFWSPGGGLRWESPIGAMRATLAHGFVSGGGPLRRPGQEHWQFYFSFGEEF